MLLKQDTTRSARQWHIDGIPGYWFSTPDDAREAVMLAGVASALAIEHETGAIREVLEEAVETQGNTGESWNKTLLDLLPSVGTTYRFPWMDWRSPARGTPSRAATTENLISRA